MLDTKALAEATAVIVREHVEKATAPLIARIAQLEAREPKQGEPGLPGKDADPEVIRQMVVDAVSALPVPADGKDGEPGKDADPDVMKAMVREAVQAAVAAIPVPKDGADGRDGKDFDEAAAGIYIRQTISEAVAALPQAERGEKGEQGERGERGGDGADGKDGAGIADLLIDRDGHLIATFTDGRMKALGNVVGRDGRDGADGKDGIPFGVDDIDMVLMEDGRTLRFAFTKGDTEYAFQIPFPVMLYRGVWQEGHAYEEGDTVTWGGSLWHADKATASKPDGGDWTLCAKKGRDGKDAPKT